jgi:hypothetical protein
VRSLGRAIGLDVHRDFCEVAVAADGAVRSAGRVETTPERLELFAQGLGGTTGWRWRWAATPGRSRGSWSRT